MISIQFAEAAPINPTVEINDLLQKAAVETLRQADAPAESGLGIVITDDSQLQKLNREYLGIDAPTDVLSFPADETDPDTGELYLGDILISYPRALAQSESGGHSLQDELQLLVVHGALHLLGYDHVEEPASAKMWITQAEILKTLGSPIRLPGQITDLAPDQVPD